MSLALHENTVTHNRRLAMVAKYTHNAIVITDANGLVEWVNDGFTRLTGYTLEDVFGTKPGKILQGPDSSPVVIEKIRQALKAEQHFDVELINYRKDGMPYWVRIECVPLREPDNTLTGFMAIESDISGRKQYEDMLIQARKEAEAANDARVQFLNNISHELRTPMNAIIGLSTLLDDTHLNHEQQEYINDILVSSDRLLTLIENLFTFSNKELAETALIREPISVDEIINSLESKYSDKALKKGVQFICGLSEHTPPFIFGNRDLIYQVVDNLCDNALKFTKRGYVKVSIELTGTAFARVISVKVVDTGIGFEPDQLTNLFSPFNQEDKSLTRSFEGAGMGLFASQRIARQIGGDIELSSTKNIGTTAKFWWPVH
ncbi:MAG: PAS domain-containing sensor histidine kinase [Chloroflexota bacterium]